MTGMGKIGLQIYSVLGIKPDQLLTSLEKLAKIGYEGVEFLDCNPAPSAKEIRQTLDALGIVSSGIHTSYDSLINNFDAVLAYSLEIGAPYIVIPRLPPVFQIGDTCKKAAEALYPVAEQCKKNGICLVYHFHDWEIIEHEGKCPMDFMAEILPEDLFSFQAEIFWLECCGVDPVGFINKYKNRIVSLHIADKKSKSQHLYTELGMGVIDLKPIVETCRKIGMDWYNVEQEDYAGDMFTSLEYDCRYLKKLLGK
jgi:sugar phosphate isomerase/epimerase